MVKALLGPKINTQRQSFAWSDVEYVGSALTDAEIVLGLATNDWAELGFSWFDSDFSEWVQGGGLEFSSFFKFAALRGDALARGLSIC